MNKLINYLPPFLRDVKEYKEIFIAEEKELEKLEIAIKEILKETSVETAESYGLDKYEKIFDITKTTDNIVERRFKIKLNLSNRLPFNMKWLEEKLKGLVGVNNYKINLDTDNFTITIQISHIFPDIADLLKKDLDKLLPANLIITINLFRTETSNLYVGGILHIGKYVQVGGVN